ncbi:hypothetical protein PVAP13_4NG074319 [Panicum virgatum]|uniref:Uncharacterized protein n=1 Tax=Panicum virgatum TaxID=38727 RepID=A0A8T0T321_PANVG|nr:hypothetical protein PVAP13_4NG074319 [Panicum virgatum]
MVAAAMAGLLPSASHLPSPPPAVTQPVSPSRLAGSSSSARLLCFSPWRPRRGAWTTGVSRSRPRPSSPPSPSSSPAPGTCSAPIMSGRRGACSTAGPGAACPSSSPTSSPACPSRRRPCRRPRTSPSRPGSAPPSCSARPSCSTPRLTSLRPRSPAPYPGAEFRLEAGHRADRLAAAGGDPGGGFNDFSFHTASSNAMATHSFLPSIQGGAASGSREQAERRRREQQQQGQQRPSSRTVTTGASTARSRWRGERTRAATTSAPTTAAP